MNRMRTIIVAISSLFLLYCVYEMFNWTVNRVGVRPGESLMLRYKGPLIFGFRKYAEPGKFAEPGQIGVLKEMKGPGRHFYCPIWWERTVVKDLVVEPKSVAVVTSKLGNDTPPNKSFLVDGDIGETQYKGVLRKVLGPGRYKLNSYAYEYNVIQTKQEKVDEETKTSGWVRVPTGYVGVVTYLTDNESLKKKAGIQDEVLPAGLYAVNPREMQVDLVSIGYNVTEISVKRQQKMVKYTDGSERPMDVVDDSGEAMAVEGSGIYFLSTDGFKIHMDFSAVWGLMPDQCPDVIRTFGNIHQVEQKVIIPQSESICRNYGSKYGSQALLVGDSRQVFQDETTKEFQKILTEKDISLLYGLIRHIYIPQEARAPVQAGYIAEELTLTREQERLAAEAEGKLKEETQKVEQATIKVTSETKRLIASVTAEGEKVKEETAAETKTKVAAVDKQIAELQAKKTVTLGEAENNAKKLQAEAKADMFGLAVKAFGQGEAYTRWQFAENLPEDIQLQMLYAGEGTLWTDLKNLTPVIPIKTPAKAAVDKK